MCQKSPRRDCEQATQKPNALAMEGVVNAAPVVESGPARKQRLADERMRDIDRRREQERLNPHARRDNSRVGAMKVDASGRIVSGMPVKAKKNKGRQKREMEQAARVGAQTQRYVRGQAHNDGRPAEPEVPLLNYDPNDPDGPDPRPYVPKEENMTPWERERNARGKKPLPKHRQKKRKRNDADPQPSVQLQEDTAGAEPVCHDASTSRRCEAGPSHTRGAWPGGDAKLHARAQTAPPVSGRLMCVQSEEVEAGEMVGAARQQQIEVKQRMERREEVQRSEDSQQRKRVEQLRQEAEEAAWKRKVRQEQSRERAEQLRWKGEEATRKREDREEQLRKRTADQEAAENARKEKQLQKKHHRQRDREQERIKEQEEKNKCAVKLFHAAARPTGRPCSFSVHCSGCLRHNFEPPALSYSVSRIAWRCKGSMQA